MARIDSNRTHFTQNLPTMPKILWMSADEVVEFSLKASRSKRVLLFPELINKTIVLLYRMGLLPISFKVVMKMARIELLKTPRNQ